MSVAGGLENAFADGARAGCDSLQVFVKNQRQWSAPPLTDKQIAAYQQAERDTGLKPVVAHASYLLNLASPDGTTRKRSIHAMIDELSRCEALGVSAMIFHPGAHLNGEGTKARRHRDTEGNDDMQSEPQAPARGLDSPLALRVRMESNAAAAGIERIAKALDEVHRRCAEFQTMILLETTAGQGTAIGYRFEQLASILDAVRESDRLGLCLDTCHLFAAGYDFRFAEGYEAMIDELDRAIGVARVKCIHVNDSKRECGSRVDRHEHIGKGKIGKSGFARFINDPRFLGVPMILETPKGKDGRGSDLDKVNLRRLRTLIS